jgi:hypothetical protein
MPSDGKSSHCLWQGELKILKSQYSIKIDFFFSKTSEIQMDNISNNLPFEVFFLKIKQVVSPTCKL